MNISFQQAADSRTFVVSRLATSAIQSRATRIRKTRKVYQGVTQFIIYHAMIEDIPTPEQLSFLASHYYKKAIILKEIKTKIV
jgi:hypothetical protein